MDLHEFEALSPEEQARVFHLSPFREKSDLLLHSYDPQALTRSLTSEELYLVTREMDIDERSEVIRYATLPQLFFIADMDCWKQDRLHPKGFVHWLETLMAAGDSQLLLWMMQMDYESVVAGLQRVIKVMKPDREWTPDDVLGDIPFFTIDQMYYIFVDEENLQTVKQALELLFENHRGRYFAILEGILGEVEDQLEEEAYSRREMRLAERGFPDFESAQRLFCPISRTELDAYPVKEKINPENDSSGQASPNYVVLWTEDRFFFDEVLHSLSNDTSGLRDQLQEELAWVSNKVIVYEGMDLSSEAKVRKGVERARAFINLGLESLSGRKLEAAQKIVREKWLEVIFRWGIAILFELRDQAKGIVKQYWKNSDVDFYNFLEAPYDAYCVGLFRKVPQYYDASLKSKDAYRDFGTLEEVEAVRQIVREIQKRHAGEFKKNHK